MHGGSWCTSRLEYRSPAAAAGKPKPPPVPPSGRWASRPWPPPCITRMSGVCLCSSWCPCP
eukprot:351450-Chlamydomonas_euryale.AAC.1